MTDILVIQAIGFIAMAFDLYATFHKTDKKVIIFHGLGSFIFSIHYFLLGAFAGAISEFLNATRNGIASYKRSRVIGLAFFLIYAGLLVFIPENLLDACPYIAGLFISIGIYYFEGFKMRLLLIVGFTLWIIYSTYVGSWSGIALFTTMVITSSYTAFRLLREQKP